LFCAFRVVLRTSLPAPVIPAALVCRVQQRHDSKLCHWCRLLNLIVAFGDEGVANKLLNLWVKKCLSYVFLPQRVDVMAALTRTDSEQSSALTNSVRTKVRTISRVVIQIYYESTDLNESFSLGA